MIWLYIAASIFGGTFVLGMLAGGLDLDSDLDFDADADFDLDTSEMSADNLTGEDVASAGTDFFGSLLSFRSIVFFSLFFGLAGLVFDRLDYTEPAPLLTGSLLGLIAAVLNTQLFRWLSDNETSSMLSDRAITGSRGTVVLPLEGDQKGRIKAEIEGQTTFLVALPHSAKTDRFDVGDSVVVVEIENGTALVAPLPGSALGEEHTSWNG